MLLYPQFEWSDMEAPKPKAIDGKTNHVPKLNMSSQQTNNVDLFALKIKKSIVTDESQ